MFHVLRQHVREDGCEENKVERRGLEGETIFARLVFPVGVINFVFLTSVFTHMLDVGSGTGRMARPLTRYLKGGSYEGIDIVARSVQWCQRTYASRYPNFRFHFADIYNKVYNPDGKHKASEYRLPFETSSFDFFFLTSVFTHMLPQDMEHYLSEV